MKPKTWKRSTWTLVVLFVAGLSFTPIVGADGSDTDRAITARVQEKIQSDSRLSGADIVVETRDGEVTLKGMVNSNEDFTRAGKLAGWVDGVKRVDNRLKTVKASSSRSYGGSSRAPDCPVGANWAC
ncbi:MAG: BON domain-containing protein [Desulfobacterales bacterium]|jgi:hyperosmotically inducible protein|nr:BON domain-containing protein [Desulfobacterales bacterium]